MNINDLISATARPYSSLERRVQIGGWLYALRTLAFSMQAQTESNWCWAATSTSVSLFYWSWSGWTQCKVACNVVNLTTCCDSPVPDACNQPEKLSDALTVTKNLSSFVSTTVSFDTVKAEIDAGRVVCARIGWSGGGGHFVAIRGYVQILDSLDFFEIGDPIYGNSTVSVSDFTTKYQTTGSWTHTYFTKSYIHLPFIPILVAEEVLRRIAEQRVVLGVQAGLPVEQIEKSEGRTIGLAHAIFTLGLHDLARGEAQAAHTGVRLLEFEGAKARAFFDVENAQTGQVQQMSASGPYLELFPRALAASKVDDKARCELRLLRAPALNFEALWLHFPEGAEDEVIPLRGFHGFAPMQSIPYREAVEKLRHAAQSVSRAGDDEKGA